MTNALIESTIKNHLKLFSSDGEPDINKTAKLLDLSRTQLAECFGLSRDQIRSNRLSELAKNRVGELAGTLEAVAEIFSGNIEKTLFWIRTPNPHFGGLSPRNLIVRGRYNKVQQFVQAAVARQRDVA